MSNLSGQSLGRYYSLEHLGKGGQIDNLSYNRVKSNRNNRGVL
jgi:hypothetical protein